MFQMLRTAAAVLALTALSAPVMAGEFFTGTRSESSRFDNARTSTGHESVQSFRSFKNEIKGSSHKHFVNVALSAENGRMGSRSYGFIEGDSEFNAEALGTGAGIFGAGGGGTWNGGGGGFGGLGDVAAAGSLGSEIDGMAGTGHERYLDGSIQASAEWGGAQTDFKLSENGNSKYRMNGDFAEVSTEDGNRSSGGSVFSFN